MVPVPTLVPRLVPVVVPSWCRPKHSYFYTRKISRHAQEYLLRLCSESLYSTPRLALAAKITGFMPKVTGLERINEERELLRLLRKLYEAQRTQPDRKCVASFIRRLQQVCFFMTRDALPWELLGAIPPAAAYPSCLAVQEPTEKASKATTLCISTEQALWMKDNDEHSYRSVHRLLCAGTHFNAVPTASKAECVKDFERLLGHFWTLTDFPVKRGRLFIAGKDSLPYLYAS